LRASTEHLIQLLGYQFTQPKLLEQALTHRSAGHTNNERLEFLGDAMLGFVIAEALFSQHPHADEGQLSRLRAGLVKKESLATVARSLSLGDHLHLGAGELRSGGHTRDSILADAMEAVFAAVYLDGGLAVMRQLIFRLYDQQLREIASGQIIKDPKTQLQELLQARGISLPEYGILEIGGSPHEQSFRVFCKIAEYSAVTEGNGSSRRRAEQQAAELMLKRLLKMEFPAVHQSIGCVA
jgi:ribonuclease-3